VEDLYHLHTVLAHVVVKLDLLEELLRDALKRIRGPLLEPIDGCAVDQAWEISDSAAEDITNARGRRPRIAREIHRGSGLDP
jgi:hypothetical protein